MESAPISGSLWGMGVPPKLPTACRGHRGLPLFFSVTLSEGTCLVVFPHQEGFSSFHSFFFLQSIYFLLIFRYV